MLRGSAGEEWGPKAVNPIIEIADEADAADETGDWWGTTEEFFELDQPDFPPNQIDGDDLPPVDGRLN